MSQRFKIQEFDKTENELLLDFYNKPVSSSGNINLVLDHSPDIWKSLTVEGYNNNIIAAIDINVNKIVAAMICSQKECFLNGQIQPVGYLSGLKVLPEYQGTIVTALLIKHFRKWWDNTKPVIWFFSVFNDNKKSVRLFDKKNSVLPDIQVVGETNTYIFKKRYFPVGKYSSLIKVRKANRADVSSIMQFIKEEGKYRAFLPDYNESDLIDGKGLLNQFNIDNLVIAEVENEIVGIMGIWYQSATRRWKVTSYSKKVRFFRPLINLGAKIFRMPELPTENSEIKYRILSLMLAKNDDSEIFKAMFNHIMRSEERNDGTYSITIKKDNPLNGYFKKRSIQFSNSIYLTVQPENRNLIENLNLRNLYIEQGGL